MKVTQSVRLLTSLDLVWLHVLPRHGVILNYVGQSRGREVLLAGLLLRAMFP